ncbi:MAG TPA: SDR family oxidoreductase [Paracoccaceae bacterium]|nr:SDR family oxidoreductase [Paracoccaceae bacterium]
MARTLVVTGASAGIGRAVARRFLGEGWNVALIARRADKLIEAADGFAEALCLTCDVTDSAAVDHAFASTVARFGRVDVLFNNAGIFRPAALIDEMPLADWDATVAVNLHGMIYAARAAFRQMRAQAPQGGRIINNGSISAHAPRPGSLGYTVTKHAITGLTKVLALDGRPFGIACGQIDIGNAETELAASLGQGARQADGSVRPEPLMDVAHVADAVLTMANLPPSANVLNMTLMATAMPFVGRG